MAFRAIKHKFTGTTTPIASYDYTKTNLGTLMVQNTGSNPQDKYAGPLPVGITRPMQEVVDTVGTVQVTTTAVTGSGTNFQTSMIGMVIGFGSTNPAKITTWYSISARASTIGITLSSTAGTIAAGTAYVIVANAPMMFPHAMTFSSTVDWIFMIENLATSVAPRKIFMYEFNKTTSVYTWKGFIVATLPSTANANTIRGFRALRYLHTTGTASANTTAVTGVGTTWQSDRLAVGARIGFGSTDPTAISTWYVISAIGSDTGITLSASAGSVGSGAYVIEELRFVITYTQATTPTNGGLVLAKGINYSDFLTTGTTISTAVSTDNVKAMYWISDAATTANVVTNVASCGCTIQTEVNKTTHYAYVLDGLGSAYMKVYRYNLRATGTITSGKMLLSISDILCTGNSLVAGTVVGVNNGRIGTLNHGPGAGVESLYFVTTTRIYRAALSKIYAGNLDWVSDNRPEIPTGSISSYPATSALATVEIADSMDRLIVLSTGATAFRNYVTRYPIMAGDAFDHIWGVDDKQQDQILAGGSAYISSGTVAVSGTAVTGTNTFFTSAMVGFRIGFGSTDPTAISTWYTISAWTSITSITLSSSAGTIGAGSAYVIDWNSNTVPHFSTSSQTTSLWSENGIAHIVKQGTTSALNQMYSLPLAAHWTYASTTNQRIITPVIYTPDCTGFQRVVVVDDDRLGNGEFTITPEPFRIYYRTKGIYDNSGEWTLAIKDGDLTSLASSPRIQFMFEFVTIGWFCIPSRIMSLTVIYDDEATVTDSHYQPSTAKSDAANKKFAWRFATAFGGTVPTLRIRLYDSLTGDLLIDDYTVGSKGSWEKATDGVTFGAYNTTDKGNETTYIRYTPLSLGDNIKVRAVLTQ